MIRLKTKGELERQRKRNSMIIGIIMLGILVTSVAGFALYLNPYNLQGSGSGSISGEGSAGSLEGNTYNVINYGGQIFYLLNSKEEVSGVEVEIESGLESFTGNTLYLDIGNSQVLSEIGSTIGRLASRVQEACYGKCEKNLPEKNCTNGNIIVWRESEQNRVYQEGQCTFIEGSSKSADAFLYELFKEN